MILCLTLSVKLISLATSKVTKTNFRLKIRKEVLAGQMHWLQLFNCQQNESFNAMGVIQSLKRLFSFCFRRKGLTIIHPTRILVETQLVVALSTHRITDCMQRKFQKMRQDKPLTEEELLLLPFNYLKMSGTIFPNSIEKNLKVF